MYGLVQTINEKLNRPLPTKTITELYDFFKTDLKPKLIENKDYNITENYNNETLTLTLMPWSLTEDDLISLLGILTCSVAQ